MLPIVLVLLVIALIASLPAWGYNKTRGYGASGIIAIVLVVLFMWFLMNLKEVDEKRMKGKTEIERYRVQPTPIPDRQ